MSLAVWWLIGALLLGLIELATVDLTFLMLAIGALGASGATWAGAEPLMATGVFVVLSSLLLLTLRPWIKRRLDKSTPNVKTNAAGLVGVEVKVLEAVDSNGGRVRLQGEVWSATCSEPLGVGAKARVVRIEGATAVIEPLSL